jgi:hypothetical protein
MVLCEINETSRLASLEPGGFRASAFLPKKLPKNDFRSRKIGFYVAENRNFGNGIQTGHAAATAP